MTTFLLGIGIGILVIIVILFSGRNERTDIGAHTIAFFAVVLGLAATCLTWVIGFLLWVF